MKEEARNRMKKNGVTFEGETIVIIFNLFRTIYCFYLNSMKYLKR